MKICILLLAGSLLASPVFGRQSPATTDLFMVDWQGSITLNEQSELTATNMGPLDDGCYEAHFVADKIWAANARANGESGPRNSCERAFVELDPQTVFQRSRKLAHSSNRL